MTGFEEAVLVMVAAILALCVFGVGVVVYTQLHGTRVARQSSQNLLEVMLLVEEMARKSQRMIAQVGEQVGLDMPASDLEELAKSRRIQEELELFRRREGEKE